tara:strand:+ start:4575 stop:5336 length:762 start_codon:yes stop_codon:yes gene_type:complete
MKKINPRVIPVLTLKGDSLIKTQKFKSHKYIGDPLNAVKIFNEKEVDELVILDIFACKENRAPNFKLLKNIATECFMPLAYGGGIQNLSDIKNVFNQGVEKVILNTQATNYDLLNNAAQIYGNQSIVVSIDVKKDFWGKYQIYSVSGTKKVKITLDEHLKNISEAGAGEVIIQSIDNDGMMNGFDLNLIDVVSNKLNLPLVAIGGAGNLNHFKEAFQHGASGIAASSFFVFKGKLNAVLISYPSQKELNSIFK